MNTLRFTTILLREHNPVARTCRPDLHQPQRSQITHAANFPDCFIFAEGLRCQRDALPASDPLLYALPVMLLACIEVAPRIDGNRTDGEQLAWKSSACSEASHFRERIALQQDHFLVMTVSDEDVALLRIVGEGDVPH